MRPGVVHTTFRPGHGLFTCPSWQPQRSEDDIAREKEPGVPSHRLDETQKGCLAYSGLRLERATNWDYENAGVLVLLRRAANRPNTSSWPESPINQETLLPIVTVGKDGEAVGSAVFI